MNTYKVLLVEDNQDTSSAVAEMLTAHADSICFEVTEVGSIADCLAEIKRTNNSYDVILLDLNLPNGKGEFTFLRIYDAANIDKDLPTANRTPIVVLTATDVQFSDLIRKGAMDVLLKPVGNRELRKSLWMAILNFPFRKAKELYQDLHGIVTQSLTELGNPP